MLSDDNGNCSFEEELDAWVNDIIKNHLTMTLRQKMVGVWRFSLLVYLVTVVLITADFEHTLVFRDLTQRKIFFHNSYCSQQTVAVIGDLRLSPTNTGTVSYSAGSGYISNTHHLVLTLDKTFQATPSLSDLDTIYSNRCKRYRLL